MTKGYTLIETLLGLALLAVLFVFSVMSYSSFMHRNDKQTLIDEINVAVQYAKAQAILLGNPVYLAPLSSTFNWSEGMVLNQLNKHSGKMELLFQWQFHHPNWRMSWSGVNAAKNITLSNNPAKAISNGQFVLTNNHTKEEVVIILNRLGRIRIK